MSEILFSSFSSSRKQAHRETRTREQEAGAPATSVEAEHWTQVMNTFWEPKPEEPNKRGRKTYSEIQRSASLDWIRELDNAFRHGISAAASHEISWGSITDFMDSFVRKMGVGYVAEALLVDGS